MSKKASLEIIKTGVANYIDNEILSQTSGMQKFLMSAVSIAVFPKIDEIFSTYSNNEVVKLLELAENNSAIEIEKIYNIAKEAIQKSGQFIIFGIIITETEIDKIYSYIEKLA